MIIRCVLVTVEVKESVTLGNVSVSMVTQVMIVHSLSPGHVLITVEVNHLPTINAVSVSSVVVSVTWGMRVKGVRLSYDALPSAQRMVSVSVVLASVPLDIPVMTVRHISITPCVMPSLLLTSLPMALSHLLNILIMLSQP